MQQPYAIVTVVGSKIKDSGPTLLTFILGMDIDEAVVDWLQQRIMLNNHQHASNFCCSYVLGVDIDEEALATCSSNVKEFEISNMDLLQSDIHSLVSQAGRLHNAFDTVIMNPPFGTKHNRGGAQRLHERYTAVFFKKFSFANIYVKVWS